MTTGTDTRKQTAGQAEDAALQLEEDLVLIMAEELGMHEREATPIAHALVTGLRRRYGGRRLGRRDLYIPVLPKDQRDQNIRREFNGRNGEELMTRYGIKRSRFYQIIGAPRVGGNPSIGMSSPAAPAAAGAFSPVCSRETGLDNLYRGQGAISPELLQE